MAGISARVHTAEQELVEHRRNVRRAVRHGEMIRRGKHRELRVGARSKTKGGEELRLTAAVRAQQAKVDKITMTLVEVGVSERLRTLLLREEERLRDCAARRT